MLRDNDVFVYAGVNFRMIVQRANGCRSKTRGDDNNKNKTKIDQYKTRGKKGDRTIVRLMEHLNLTVSLVGFLAIIFSFLRMHDNIPLIIIIIIVVVVDVVIGRDRG